MKRFYRTFIIVLAMLLTITNIKLSVKAEALPVINTVFVLDASRSMKKSDPEFIRIEAMKLFIDMCRGKGDKIGIDAYGSTIVKEIPLKKIESDNDREMLKSDVGNIPDSTSTDIGLGLMKGIENLEIGMDKNGIPIIILLSDGKNDPARSLDKSNEDILKAVNISKEKGYKIYTIGLNADGSVDEKLLKDIANETGGKSFIINSSKELPMIFSMIFAESSQLKIIPSGSVSCNGDFQRVNIEIPNSNITEANISVTSKNGTQLIIEDTNGQSIDLKSEGIYYSSSNKYSLLKIKNPVKGSLILGVKGAIGDTAELNLIYNYDVKLKVNFNPDGGYKKGEVIKINAYLLSNNRELEDSAFYSGLKGKILIKNSDNSIKEIEMTNTDKGFEGSIAIEDENYFDISVCVEGSGLNRETPYKRIEIENSISEDKNASDVDSSDIKEEKNISKDTVIYIIIALIAVLTAVFLIVYKKKRPVKPYKGQGEELFGKIMITIFDENINERFPPIIRKLDGYKSGAYIKSIIPELSEYSEFDGIRVIIKNGKVSILNENMSKVHQRVAGDNEASIINEKVRIEKLARIVYIKYLPVKEFKNN